MAQLLKLAHLVDEHRMAQMQIGRGGVEAGLDAQGFAPLQALSKLGLDQNLIGSSPYLDHLIRDGIHRAGLS